MSIFDFFDRVYVIHLPNPERLALMQAELARVGIAGAQFIHANPPRYLFEMSNMRRAPAAEFGANLSHLKAVMRAVADGAERPLFLEDDVVFNPDAETLLTTSLASLPADWDVLYLGGHPREPVTRTGRGLVKVGRFSFAEAYALNRKALLPFIEMWVDRIGAYDAMYDFILGEFADGNHGYCVFPLVCWQAPNVSQISGKMEDKRELVERGWVINLGERGCGVLSTR